MLDLRTRLLLMIGGAALVIALIIGSILLNKNSGEEPVVVEEDASTQATETSLPVQQQNTTAPDVVPTQKVATTPAPVPQTPEEKQALFVRQVARDFVERFLSYSNKNDNKHLTDVEVLVTPTMWQWVKTQIIAYSKDTVSQETKVVSTSVISIEGNTANVSVGAQQVITDSSGTKTVYKKGRVELLQIGGTWRVNGLFWE